MIQRLREWLSVPIINLSARDQDQQKKDFASAARRVLEDSDATWITPRRTLPLQIATNGEFPGAPRNANAHQRKTYADGQRARAERTGLSSRGFRI